RHITLAWTFSGNNQTGFKLQRKIAGDAFFSQTTVLAANVFSYNDIGVSSNTTYVYQVIAFNSGGDSAATSQASQTTPPSAPTNLTLIPISASEIDLAWTDPSNGTATFKLQRKSGISL